MAPALLEIAIPKEYGYVLVTVASSFLIASWHGIRVGGYRKRAQIPYPNAYASASQLAAAKTPEKKQALELFNCAQRGHYNFLENYPAFLAGILLSGLKYPLASTGLGVTWLVSRIFYAVGYTNPAKEGGKGRYASGLGMLHNVSALGFVYLVAKSGYDFIMA